MSTSDNTLIKCTCCGDDVAEDKSKIDPDLGTPVCLDCVTQLRWAQAHLKTAGIKGCSK